MNKRIQIEFTLNEANFSQKLQDAVDKKSELDLLQILNIPSTSKALQLISQNWFELKINSYSQLTGIILNITESINDLPVILDLFLNKSILIAFQSTVGEHVSKIYWKSDGRDKFCLLDIDDDSSDGVIASICQDFLVGEIKNGRTGILEKFQFKSKIRLHEIGDSVGRNLLVQATHKRQQNVIENLLKQDFDADDAIDIAWKLFEDIANVNNQKDEASKIILCLLRANSGLPTKFDYEKASQEVKDFVDKCESLHKDVDNDAFEDLKLKIESEPNLVHFYNRKNESLLAYALKSRKFKIFDLMSKEITTGGHEDLDEVYENMYRKECGKLRDQHKTNAREFPATHIFILKSRSKIGNNDRLSHKKWKFIDEAFETLNRNDFCRKILKVAVEFKKLKIYFDFKHDSTYYLDPATSIYSKGIIYEGGSIFIGAKNMTDDEKKFAVFGVLAHELCHLAVYMAFMNRNFDPFPIGASADKMRFLERVMVQCKEREVSEGIVANVFNSYDKDVQDSEMIVTVAQMLIQYVNNAEKIQELKGIFEELFNYCKEVVEPELDRALPVLKILLDENNLIKFADLTDPMKAKISHSKIIFQGSETTFNDLIGNDEELLKLLTSKNLRDIVMRNQKLKIGEICELNLKYGLTERFFLDQKLSSKFNNSFYNREVAENQQTAEQVRENSKVFILADHAGTGKTTIFKNCAIKLKQNLPNFWISFIRLRKCTEIFKKLPNNGFDRNVVLQMLVSIINPDSKLERKIFSKLFAAGQVILLFDGVDEICPKYTKILAEIFKVLLNNYLKNEFWLSTRPHYAAKLETFFQTSAYKFAIFIGEEKKNLIQKILKVNKVPDNQKFELFEKVINGIRNLETIPEDIDNPLMIQMITELHISSEHVIDTNNHYKLFELMIEQQKREVGEKIPIEDHDKDSKLTVWDIHRILALELIVGDDFEVIKLENLTIFKKWKKEKKNWTSDMIQRYGFVVVELSYGSMDTAIDFMHRTWAEFFVAQFLMNFVFDDEEDLNDVDVKNIVNLLDLILNDNGSLTKVKEFIHSFLMYEAKNRKIHKKIKKLLFEKITKLHKNRDNFDGCDGLKSYALMGCIDADIFKKFWKT